MTAMATLTGAPTTCPLRWENINWRDVEKQVRRLQMRIAKAFREGKHGKVKSLQWLLTHSFNAKLLAVKRVTQNRGAKTAGVDGVTWNTPRQKMQAAQSLKRRGYHAQPLRRIYIPKKQKGKLRPLSIPVMHCRAQQALHLLALEPVSEMKADRNSYGFRPLRSTADAIERCFKALSQRGSAPFILEGDIKSCFDKIAHSWLRNHAPMDKKLLNQWLAAGYIEKGTMFQTNEGTPQGGIISPTLLTVTLSGLERAIKSAAPRREDKVYVCTYADDFIVTGATKEVLEQKVKPAIQAFLKLRGLSLSQEKTKITHIDEGFDFLGMTIRKYNGKLIIKPAKESVEKFLANIRHTIKSNAVAKTDNLLRQLNLMIRGWTNYYRHVCAKSTFSFISHRIFQTLWQWAKRRHPNKNTTWIKNKYFRSDGKRNWIFSTVINRNGHRVNLDWVDPCRIRIERHIKIKADAHPYDPIYWAYLENRRQHRTRKVSRKKNDNTEQGITIKGKAG